jgi:hypothetical protein
MDIIIENDIMRVISERNDVTAKIDFTPAVKSFILAVYQAGRDKEMIDFNTTVEPTMTTAEEQTN